jgi:hypothetical protein
MTQTECGRPKSETETEFNFKFFLISRFNISKRVLKFNRIMSAELSQN